MGVRLSGGVGPLRVSVPLSGRRRRSGSFGCFAVFGVLFALVAPYFVRPLALGIFLGVATDVLLIGAQVIFLLVRRQARQDGRG